jgi:hypothetical protein
MSHLVNPTGFRTGKTFLWKHTSLKLTNKQNLLNNYSNDIVGIESVMNKVLQKKNYWLVKSVIKHNSLLGSYDIKVLIYPLAYQQKRLRRVFPLSGAARNILSKTSKITLHLTKFLGKLWLLKSKTYAERLIKTKARKNLNKWLKRSMFRGNFFYKKLKKWKAQTLLHELYFKQLKNYSVKKNMLKKWKRSKKQNYLNNLDIAKFIEKRTGLRANIKFQNIFHYLAKKNKRLVTKYNYQDHIWNKAYHYNKKFIVSFYDIVNSLLILCNIQSTESFVMQMIQQGLSRMHRYKIRPRRFFYFIDSVLKNLIPIRRHFLAIRVIITGKLQGGTGRTKSFSVGFGTMPYQSIDQNVKYEFGDVQSKYGSYGVKIFTWRKSDIELESDKRVIKNFERNKRYFKKSFHKLSIKSRLKNKAQIK